MSGHSPTTGFCSQYVGDFSAQCVRVHVHVLFGGILFFNVTVTCTKQTIKVIASPTKVSAPCQVDCVTVLRAIV